MARKSTKVFLLKNFRMNNLQVIGRKLTWLNLDKGSDLSKKIGSLLYQIQKLFSPQNHFVLNKYRHCFNRFANIVFRNQLK